MSENLNIFSAWSLTLPISSWSFRVPSSRDNLWLLLPGACTTYTVLTQDYFTLKSHFPFSLTQGVNSSSYYWDRLGPGTLCCSAAMLQCLHLDTPLLELQNTEKLYGTKNNCVHAQLGQILDPKDTKGQKTQLPFLKSQEQKLGVRTTAEYYACPPTLNTTKGWAHHLSHHSGPTPGHTLTLTPYREWARPSLGSEQGNLLLVFASSCSRHRSPNKALPEFLVWPLVNFYWLGKAKNPGWYCYQEPAWGYGVSKT